MKKNKRIDLIYERGLQQIEKFSGCVRYGKETRLFFRNRAFSLAGKAGFLPLSAVSAP
ncbi:Uncharacterized protein dnm_072180 [Desulfonema magnum]|uniref:Uncharacterized protein n=1 Tax=Desulfonema magnum TaxID=45655 RepID=A0A975GSJ5_9BACT|nr:Uncharacterized protein dnm_072180 [Desulfonema magnum]